MRQVMWTGALLMAATMGTAQADARSEVLDAFRAAMAQKSYRATSTSTVEGQDHVVTIDVMLPASFHMRSPDTEAVILPAGTWIKAAGQWMKVPMDMSQMVGNLTVEAMQKGADAIRTVEKTGSGSVGGCDATHYRYDTEGEFMGQRAHADVELSVCDATGLPVRVVSKDPKGGVYSTITYDFDAPIEIRPPN